MVTVTAPGRLAAHIVSIVLNPFTNALPVFAILLAGASNAREVSFMPTFGVALVFGSLLPVAYVAYIKRQGQINEWDVADRTARLKPLAFGVASYLMGFLLLAWLGVRGYPLALMFCHITNTLAVLVITTRWKISIHAIGISAPLMILHMAYGNIVWVWWGLVPLVAGSRVVLQKHTLAQVTTGAALGIIMTFVQVNLFFK